MTINTPTQAFDLRDKLAELFTEMPSGGAGSEYAQADAEFLLRQGVIDTTALAIRGLDDDGKTVLTLAQVRALPQFALVQFADGERAWKRDEDETPWNSAASGYMNDQDVAARQPTLVVA